MPRANESEAKLQPATDQVQAAKICLGSLQLACLETLAGGPVSVSVIVQRVGWTQPEVSRALARLRSAGYVSFCQSKQERTYSITHLIRIGCEGDRLTIDIPSQDGGVIRLIRPSQRSTVVVRLRAGEAPKGVNEPHPG